MSGIQHGLWIRGTVEGYNPDGTLTVALDRTGAVSSQNDKLTKVLIPNSWIGDSGQFAGGYPQIGSTVRLVQGSLDRWHCLGYEATEEPMSNIYSQIGENGYLIKSPSIYGEDNKIYVDPDVVSVGTSSKKIELSNGIASLTTNQFLSFSNSHRTISGEVKRYLKNRTINDPTDTTLSSVNYEKELNIIGMDPEYEVHQFNTDTIARNPALAETRSIYYEFADEYNFKSYQKEHEDYTKGINANNVEIVPNSKSRNRAVPLSLTLETPNHLIETIVGTVVDSFGNILDINRSILPIGKIEDLSLKSNQDKDKTYKSILRELRKSIAYHFEINTRKDLNGELNTPNPNDGSDYARSRSKFAVDIDKEGQFKINIPSSSETGNIPLLTRYENYSIFLADQNKDANIFPDTFVKPEDDVDIYIENFALNPSIKLKASANELDGYQAPRDRSKPKKDKNAFIKYGTAFHDITQVCNQFTVNAPYISSGYKLVNMDQNNRLNNEAVWKPLDKIVSDTIIVSGPDANAGGRSGMINLDGFISINVGANTIDRQSIWIDTAGGIVQSIGKDKNNISHAASFDGDVFWQIGGTGLGSMQDNRFNDSNDAYRPGTLDIRVNVGGQLAILRIGPDGIYLISPGTLNLVSQQSIIMKSNGNILMEAESIVMYAETEKRIVNRFPKSNIA